ncbi:hypothetical protein D3C72_1445300 [compost metagenome]
MAVHNVSAALLLMASPGKVEMACQLVPAEAAGEAQAQRPWVQSTVLLITMAAVLLMAVLNVVLSMALP